MKHKMLRTHFCDSSYCHSVPVSPISSVHFCEYLHQCVYETVQNTSPNPRFGRSRLHPG